jgi:hypothetical protein
LNSVALGGMDSRGDRGGSPANRSVEEFDGHE